MTFRRNRQVIVLMCIYIAFLLFGKNFINTSSYSVGAIVLGTMTLYLGSSFYHVKDGMLHKYRLILFKETMSIKDVVLIEAVTVNNPGTISITIGKGSVPEDYYLIHFNDKSTIKVDAYYRYQLDTLGQYLARKYKIKIRKTEKIQYFNGG